MEQRRYFFRSPALRSMDGFLKNTAIAATALQNSVVTGFVDCLFFVDIRDFLLLEDDVPGRLAALAALEENFLFPVRHRPDAILAKSHLYPLSKESRKY